MSPLHLREKGTTLPELLLVLFITFLLVSLLVPNLTGSLWQHEGELFIQKFTLDLYEASEEAVAGRTRVDVKIEKDKGIYRVYPWLKPSISMGQVPTGFTLDHNFTDGGFHFNTEGHISRSGSFYLFYPDGKKKRIILYMDGGVLVVQGES